MKRRLLLTIASALISLVGMAADETKEVHVIEVKLVGGVATQLRDQTLLTGGDYTTQMAPAISGQIFTHWSISRTQAFVNRDRLGRAKDFVTYHLYEPTTLTANYLPAGEDTDNDGIADGWEIYWYGDLSKNATSDTDGDGLDFAEELAAGTNPLIPNDSVEGGIEWDDGAQLQYNPDGLQPYTIRSEPEGVLFVTITDYAQPGTSVTTPTCNHLTTKFAYWTRNGVRVQDRHGRTLDGIAFAMPNEAVEYVAVCVDDAEVREQYYWYGKEMSMTSDSDGDGMTLAEEIAAGTNPLIPNESVEGGIVWNDGERLQYNIDGYQPYTIRSEPEGTLFATVKDVVKTGTALSTPVCNYSTTRFAYWTLNGVRQHDRYGRAYDQVNFAMPDGEVELVAVCVEDADVRQQQYWYGAAMSMTSDSDGDGMTLAEEVAAGTNPLIPNESVEGGIVWDDGEYLETDLQVYEQVKGAVVGGVFSELFTSPIAGNGATSETFGANLKPVVADVNGDGLFDIVLVYDGGVKVLVNVGGKGNPEFRVGTDSEVRAVQDEILAMNSTEKLDALELDTPVIGALSASVWGEALLASDTEGRIWYYRGEGSSPSLGGAAETAPPQMSYQLQHKVWGGSHAGFAQGLRLAAVDWDDDGDLDCLAGTAEGKLMLLRDPKVGKPTNLKALVGVDNVKLEWDPNQQSRIRGYKVYRADAGADEFASLVSPYTPLPTYRDYPPSVSEFDYKVSSVSRHYVAGNSTPFVSESAATEPLRIAFGGVTVSVGDAAGFAGGEVEVFVSINNTLGLAGENLRLSVKYDPAVLTPKAVATTGLSEGLAVDDTVEDGIWAITAAGGDLAPGEGRIFVLTFVAAESVGATSTTVSIAEAQFELKDAEGGLARVECVSGRVKLEAYNPPPPVHASVTIPETVEVIAGASFKLPIEVAGEGVDWDTLTYRCEYDESVLALNEGVFTAADVTENVTTVVTLKDVSAQAVEAGCEVVFDSIGQCAVTIKAAQVETDPGDGDDAGDMNDGDDENFGDWLENIQGITRFGIGAFGVGDAKGRIGEEVEVAITFRSGLFFRDLTVDYSTLRFRLAYDPTLLEPVGIAAAAGEYGWSAKDGILTVCGRSGSATVGRHPAKVEPLAVRFRLREQYAVHTAMVVPLVVQVRTVDGAKVFTPVRWPGTVAIDYTRPADDPSVVAPWSLGDLNGDGRLTKEDRQLLAKLMNGNGKKVNARQLAAGDYNGNGRLDNGDYQLLTEDFRRRGIIK